MSHTTVLNKFTLSVGGVQVKAPPVAGGAIKISYSISFMATGTAESYSRISRGFNPAQISPVALLLRSGKRMATQSRTVGYPTGKKPVPMGGTTPTITRVLITINAIPSVSTQRINFLNVNDTTQDVKEIIPLNQPLGWNPVQIPKTQLIRRRYSVPLR